MAPNSSKKCRLRLEWLKFPKGSGIENLRFNQILMGVTQGWWVAPIKKRFWVGQHRLRDERSAHKMYQLFV